MNSLKCVCVWNFLSATTISLSLSIILMSNLEKNLWLIICQNIDICTLAGGFGLINLLEATDYIFIYR